MIGTILSNRYKIVEKLGSGGMAWVYLAQDLREQQQVAVKILYPQHSQDLSFLQRFMQEARLAMSLSECGPTRQIVCVLDYGSDRDTHYLVMEYVPGQDLSRVLAEHGALPWRKALEIARQVALALEHAYQQGVVHRDIKPGNIMITADGSVRVLDFGIARARGSPELTLSGFVGSPHYAAPEQAMGETVDIRADIYSLGIVLYRMLSGDLPFHGPTPWAIANQHIASPPPPLEEPCPDLPLSVIHLVRRAMAKRPEDRFQTPAELVDAIENVLAGHDLPHEGLAATALPVEEFYRRGQQAMEAQAWHEAVDLFNQVLNHDPGHRAAAEGVNRASREIRLAALYQAAERMVQMGQWDEAIVRLEEMSEIAPGYRDVVTLLAQARTEQQALAAEESELSDYPTQIEIPGASHTPVPPHGSHKDGEAPEPAPSSRRGEGSGRAWLGLLIAVLLMAVVAGGYGLLRKPGSSPGGLMDTQSVTPSLVPGQAPSPTDRPSATLVATPATEAIQATATTTSVAGPAATSTASATPLILPTSTPTPMLALTGAPSPTTVARLSGQIAFPRFDPTRGTYDVYTCLVDGTGCRRLVAEASQPDFSPDGRQIIVHSWKPDAKGLVLHVLSEQRIWRITDQIEAARASVDFQAKTYVYHSRQEADRQPRLYRTYGTETRPIVREGSPVLGAAPSWLPDGRILYSGCLRDSCGIIVMWADGTHPRQIVAGSTETNPEASPDGRQVAFMSQRDGNWEVYTTGLDGSGLQRLTHDPANDGLPAWSPDGQYLAFVSNRSGRWAVWAMRADGGEQRRLFDVGGAIEGQVRGAAPHEIIGWVEERLSWAPLP
jgi:predicted Ser/Thr protein kinase/tetratricopeptide (TPR) repeat protein